ncbi:MAG: heavy metal translocating P-type ATPase [Bacillus sp. (in: firmicutes)]
MAEEKLQQANKNVYRVQGLSCAGCAKTFEQNVKEIDGVIDATVNFGAAKITVVGDAEMEQVQKAGDFDKLIIFPENEKQEIPAPSFLKKYGVLVVAFIFLVIGYACKMILGEEHLATVGAYLLSIVVGGYSLFIVGFKNLFRLKFDMKTLMTVAIIGAAIIGEWSEGAVVVILFAISEALESYSMDKARQSISSLMDIAPKTAEVRRHGHVHAIPVEEIVVGDIMIVKPGQKIAMDGKVIKGYSSVNQAAITGESIPVEKTVEDDVFAGTLNGEGLLEIEVTKLVEDTTIAKMIHLVEEAQGERAPSQAFVDLFAKYYTPAIIGVAALVAVIPPLMMDASWTEWIYQGLAVLVVGCPCALVISTPVAIVTAIGNAAKKGVLIKGGIHLEEAGKIQAIAFDKTGTLTKGVPTVTDVIVLEEEPQWFAKVTALEAYSKHPLSKAFIQKAEDEGLAYQAYHVDDFQALTGRGVEGTVDGNRLFIGNIKMFTEKQIPVDKETVVARMKALQSAGKTVMLVGSDDKIVAMIAVADEAREMSKDVVAALHAMGVKQTVMLTGDSQETAQGIARQVGVSQVDANLLPQEKLEKIKELKKEYGHVAMIGDGVNDAPALAAANIGLAMGGVGSDTALETADITLMGDDLKKLPFIISLSRRTMTVIKQNISFALGLKLLALLLVIPGWLTLWIAIFADLGATLLVTLNSLRLLRVNK